MKNRTASPEHALFRRTFRTLALFSAIPLLLVFFILFFFIFHSVKNETLTANQDALREYVKQIDAQILSARVHSLKLAADPDCISFIIDPTFDATGRNRDIMQMLDMVTETNTCVDSAYLYSHFNHLILTSKMLGYRQLQFADAEALALYAERPADQPFEIRTDTREGMENAYILTIYQNVPVSSADSLGCVILNIPSRELFGLVPLPPSFSLTVYDENSIQVYSTEENTSYQQEDSFLQKAETNERPFLYSENGRRVLVLTEDSALTGMRYIAVEPMSVFYDRYRRFLLFAAIAFAAVLAASLISSMLLARKRAENYGHMTNQVRPVVKRDLFTRLLLGHTAPEENIAASLEFLQEGFTPSNYGLIAMTVPKQAEADSLRTDPGDEPADSHGYNAALTTLIAETVNRQYPFSFNRLQDDLWVLAVNIKNTTLLTRLHTLLQTAFSELSFPVISECGLLCDDPRDLSVALLEARGRLKAAEEKPNQPEPAAEIPADKFENADRIKAEDISAAGGSIEKMIAYINAHLDEDISLQDLADVCQISPSYVSRLFRERLNIGFVEYLNTLRVRRAQRLLEETDLSTEKIGQAVGFNNNRSFIRTFKQYSGLTPGQYRINRTANKPPAE